DGLWADGADVYLNDDMEATIKMTKGSITAKEIAVKVSHKGNIKLDDVEVKSAAKVGLWADGEGTAIEMMKGSVTAGDIAVKASNAGSIKLSSGVKVTSTTDGLRADGANSSIEMTGGSVTAIHTAVMALNKGNIKLDDVELESTLGDGLWADGADVYLNDDMEATIKMTKGSITAKEIAVKASHKGNIKLDDVEVKSATKVGLWADGEGTIIEMTDGSIQAQTEGGKASNGAVVTLNNVKIAMLGKGDGSAVMQSENVGRRVGVHAEDKGVVRLNDTTLEGVHTGLRADGEEANIEMTGGKITAITGIVNEGGAVTLKNTEVVTVGDSAGVIMGKGGKTKMFGGSLKFSNNGISLRDASFAAKDVSITGTGEKFTDMVFGAAFYADKTGLITLSDSKIDVTHHHGLYIINDSDFDRSDNNYGLSLPKRLDINVGRSELLVSGDAAYGIYVMGSTLLPEHTKQVWLAESPIRERVALGTSFVSLQETTLKVPESAAIYSDHGRAYIQLSQGAEISGSLLLETKEGKDEIIIVADNSSLVGGTRIKDTSNVGFYLSNNSKWTLTKNQYEMLNGSDSKKPRDAGLPDSSISFIHLDRSSISFASQSVAPQEYQTLRIGKPGAARGDIAYYVSGGAHLYLNAYVDEKGQLDNQKTDRVLIEGSVAGRTTKVHVNGHLDVNDKKNDGKKKGISLIQVSGEAYKDSFELESGYITLGGLPYQYRLKAYGPNHSDTKKEKSVKRQRFVSGNGDNFWDFRLQEVMFGENGEELDWDEFGEDEDSLYGRHGRAFRAVAPQVPVYLVLPNAFFHTDLMDIDYQNKLLETMQVDAGDLSNKISIQGYDGSHRYTSNLTENEYGYGADVGYQGLQGSALLKTVENKHSNMFFGVMGNFGHLSLQPRQVAKGLKSTLDKWSLTAYGRVQHDNGFYANGTFSYGFLAGDVLTAERGVTVNLRGQPLSASLTTGKAFVTNYKGLVLEPQIQLIYQSVSFSEAVDVDGLNVQFDRPDQFTMRVGGRFGKTVASLQKGHFVSFYGKAHLTSSYGRDQFVYIHDAFRLGAFGSAIEGGFGVNAQLTSAVMVYGDLVYKHKLGTFGFTGTSVSGGLRYRF
ncbi:autotransporter outer membrane beta-barrel domain-containing protein, partial [Bartonella bacilliformis]